MEQQGGCHACLACVGFKSKSVNGKFCSVCSHALDKHYQGEKPVQLNAENHRRPSAASLAPARDNTLKLFADTSAEDKPSTPTTRVTPTARRTTTNQNPLAKRSPMRKDKSRSSPPNPISVPKKEEAQSAASSSGIALPGKESLVTGPSLKERLVAYSAVAKKSGTPKEEDKSRLYRPNISKLKTSASFQIFEANAGSCPMTPPPTSFPKKSESHTKQKSKNTIVEPKPETVKTENSDNCAAEPEIPVVAPPVVTIDSPSNGPKRRLSIKDRIAVYSSSSELPSSATSTPKPAPMVHKLSYDQTSFNDENPKSRSNSATLDSKSFSFSDETTSPKIRTSPKCLDSTIEKDEDGSKEERSVSPDPFKAEAVEQLSIKDMVSKIDVAMSTDPRFGLRYDSVEAADEKIILDSRLVEERRLHHVCLTVFTYLESFLLFPHLIVFVC